MTINQHNLRQFLDRYYRGESTLDEENALRYFFRNEHVPAEFETDKEMFLFTSRGSLDENQEQLNALLWEGIQKSSVKNKDRKTQLIRRISWLSVAATVLIVIAVNWIFSPKSETVLYADTFDDPIVALQQTREILFKISSSMNKGISELESLSAMNDAMDKLYPIGEMPKQIDRVSRIGAVNHPFILQDGPKN